MHILDGVKPELMKTSRPIPKGPDYKLALQMMHRRIRHNVRGSTYAVVSIMNMPEDARDEQTLVGGEDLFGNELSALMVQVSTENPSKVGVVYSDGTMAFVRPVNEFTTDRFTEAK